MRRFRGGRKVEVDGERGGCCWKKKKARWWCSSGVSYESSAIALSALVEYARRRGRPGGRVQGKIHLSLVPTFCCLRAHAFAFAFAFSFSPYQQGRGGLWLDGFFRCFDETWDCRVSIRESQPSGVELGLKLAGWVWLAGIPSNPTASPQPSRRVATGDCHGMRQADRLKSTLMPTCPYGTGWAVALDWGRLACAAC